MTNGTRPKTLNGLQGDLLSGQWLSEPLRRGGGNPTPGSQNETPPPSMEI